MGRKDLNKIRIHEYNGGFILERDETKIGLDSCPDSGIALISHSHMDHVAGFSGKCTKYATPETVKTFKARNRRKKLDITEVEIGDVIEFKDTVIEVLNAGHVLGSTMFRIIFDDGKSVLYTGDFNIVDSLVHKGARPVEADILVLDATYGRPEYVFPERHHIYSEIIQTVESILERGLIPMFKAYSLGKSQEIIALLNHIGIPVVTGNKTIDKVNEVYIESGIDLEYIALEESEHLLHGDSAIVVANTNSMHQRIRRLFGSDVSLNVRGKSVLLDLTGWSLLNSQYGTQGFPLSAHTDFPGLIEFTREVSPEIVYPFTENAYIFAKILQHRGIKNKPLHFGGGDFVQ